MVEARDFMKILGGAWHGSYGTAPCPVCQPERRRDQNALTVGSSGEKLLLNCKKSGCKFRDILAAAGAEPCAGRQLDPAAARLLEKERHDQAAKKLARARAIWNAADPIHGTPGEMYLRGRGITCPLPSSLRWLPDTYHSPSGTFGAALVADVSTGGIHRTFFAKSGERLGKSTKMMFGPCSGGAVRLSEAVGPLVVCEGIETGLSLLSGLLSTRATVWAALSTSGIRSLNLPDVPGRLTIATDGDEAGRDAGNALGRRAKTLGWEVGLLPAPDGRDWNDVLMTRTAEAREDVVME